MDSEAHLLERLKADDEAAFADFMELHQQRIYYLALRWVPDPESALDITQQTFLRAHQAIGRFRGQASLHTWLYRIALNLCKNHLRDADRAQRKLESYAEVESLQQAEEAANTSAKEFEALRGVIDRLHTRQRETLLLRVVEDLSYSVCGEVMEFAEGSAQRIYLLAV